MAEVKITIKDIEDGKISFEFEFDPVLEDSSEYTNAQYAALEILNFFKEQQNGN